MQSITIPGTDLTVSKFIFGTASLFNVGSANERVRLLEAAIDQGFTHFDTAPYYGFGTAERDLSSVLKAHPRVTITTKVGIYSPGGEDQSAVSVLLRKAGGKVVKALARPTTSFDLDRAERSLEGSLRRLGRDHIDIYMLHEPRIELLRVAEWTNWLETKVKAGSIRYFGIASTQDKLLPFLQTPGSPTQVVQMADSLDKHEASVLSSHGRPMQITYGYVSAAQARGDAQPVETIMRQALARNTTGSIIISTKRAARLSQYARWLERAA